MKKYLLSAGFLLLASIFFSCDDSGIPAGTTPDPDGPAGQSRPAATARVETREVTHLYEAPGTIRPLTESVVESQTSAKIIKVLAVPGAAVKSGQTLIELDARRLQTQVRQAKEGLSIAKKELVQAEKSKDEARAGLDQAESEYQRTAKLFKSAIVSSQKLDQDKSLFLQAKARLEKTVQAVQAANAAIRQAQEVVKEARIALSYSKITSPADGVVAKRMADPGDLAVPGKPLMILQTSGALRLEANVREGLINRVVKGGEYPVRIETLGVSVPAVVQEILPYADPDTRTFMVKASLPATKGVYPGMFGRLQIPVETETTLVIPKEAVIRIGQLELVRVKSQEESKGKSNDQWQQIYIKTGKVFGDKIEVLSGLLENELIGY